jgi:hypothetical protein
MRVLVAMLEFGCDRHHVAIDETAHGLDDFAI